MTPPKKTKKDRLERLAEKVDLRSGRTLRIRTTSKTVRLTDANWSLIDRNRLPMQLSISQYIAYCVRKVARPYDVARAQQLEGADRDG